MGIEQGEREREKAKFRDRKAERERKEGEGEREWERVYLRWTCDCDDILENINTSVSRENHPSSHQHITCILLVYIIWMTYMYPQNLMLSCSHLLHCVALTTSASLSTTRRRRTLRLGPRTTTDKWRHRLVACTHLTPRGACPPLPSITNSSHRRASLASVLEVGHCQLFPGTGWTPSIYDRNRECRMEAMTPMM